MSVAMGDRDEYKVSVVHPALDSFPPHRLPWGIDSCTGLFCLYDALIPLHAKCSLSKTQERICHVGHLGIL